MHVILVESYEVWTLFRNSRVVNLVTSQWLEVTFQLSTVTVA
jgi:hypothetical protein